MGGGDEFGGGRESQQFRRGFVGVDDAAVGFLGDDGVGYAREDGGQLLAGAQEPFPGGACLGDVLGKIDGHDHFSVGVPYGGGLGIQPELAALLAVPKAHDQRCGSLSLQDAPARHIFEVDGVPGFVEHLVPAHAIG